MSCNFCKSEKYKVYIKADNVQYVKCIECGLIYQYPVLSEEEIKSIYTDTYFEYEIANQENFFKLMKLSLNDVKFDEIAKNLPFKRVLDIGCATGLLLNHFKNKGFDCTGVEICEASANYAIEQYGIEIYKKPLESIGFDDGYFSIVHLSHLIEHVSSPSSILKEIYRILDKNGYMILTTPNESGFFSRVYNKNWRSVMPQHLWLFNMKTLIYYIKSIGFTVEVKKSWGSIPVEKGVNRNIKQIADMLVKTLNIGDVMLLLCKKQTNQGDI